MFHAGHSPDLRHSSLKESCHLSALGIQIFGKSDTHREHLIRPKAWINANKAYEAVQQQTSPISSISERATSATTRPLRSHCRDRLADPWLSSFSAASRST